VIELANTFRPLIRDDPRDSNICLVKKISRKMNSSRSSDSYWGRSQMLEEQPPKVTSAEANVLGQLIDIANVKSTFVDQLKFT
jgi:hypothetical protein